jgi:hypothetical protein
MSPRQQLLAHHPAPSPQRYRLLPPQRDLLRLVTVQAPLRQIPILLMLLMFHLHLLLLFNLLHPLLVFALDYNKVYVIQNITLMALFAMVCFPLHVNQPNCLKLLVMLTGALPWRRSIMHYLRAKPDTLFLPTATTI